MNKRRRLDSTLQEIQQYKFCQFLQTHAALDDDRPTLYDIIAIRHQWFDTLQASIAFRTSLLSILASDDSESKFARWFSALTDDVSRMMDAKVLPMAMWRIFLTITRRIAASTKCAEIFERIGSEDNATLANAFVDLLGRFVDSLEK